MFNQIYSTARTYKYNTGINCHLKCDIIRLSGTSFVDRTTG